MLNLTIISVHYNSDSQCESALDMDSFCTYFSFTSFCTADIVLNTFLFFWELNCHRFVVFSGFFFFSWNCSLGPNDLLLSYIGICGLLLTRTACWIQEQRHHHPGKSWTNLSYSAASKENPFCGTFVVLTLNTLFIYVPTVFPSFFPPECSAIFCCNQAE